MQDFQGNKLIQFQATPSFERLNYALTSAFPHFQITITRILEQKTTYSDECRISFSYKVGAYQASGDVVISGFPAANFHVVGDVQAEEAVQKFKEFFNLYGDDISQFNKNSMRLLSDNISNIDKANKDLIKIMKTIEKMKGTDNNVD